MRVYWDKLLSELGCNIGRNVECMQPCPLHPKTTPTLRVQNGRITTHFTCVSSNCSFNSGDAVQLVAAARGISSSEANALFAPDGPLYATRIDTPESRQEGYNTSDDSQVLINDYLGRCHANLTSLQGQNLLSRWNSNGWASPNSRLPDTFGALTVEDLPRALRQLDAAAYKGAFALHAYTYERAITALSIRGVIRPEQQELIRVHAEFLGIYPDITLPDTADLLYVSNDERFTTGMHSLYNSISKTVLPVVSLLDFPLPRHFEHIEHVSFLSYPGNRLPIAKALNYLCKDEIVEGSKRSIRLHVLDLRTPPDVLTLQRIQNRSAMAPETKSLTLWIARQLKHIYLTQDAQTLHQVLQEAPDLTEVKDDLLAALTSEGADETLLGVIQNQCNSEKTRVVLTNGRVVYKTPHGYRGAHDTNAPAAMRLSNVTWDIEEELMDHRGNMQYRCLLYIPDRDSPVPITLKDSDFQQTKMLAKAITQALGKQRIPSKIVLYTATGFLWNEIRDAFKKVDRTVEEVQVLGVDKHLDIHFPNMVITDGGSKVEPQHRILEMPEEACQPYRGIDYRDQSDAHLTPFVDLWAGQDLEHAALAMGISHVLYCIVQDLLCKKTGAMPGIQHLCYIDPLPETWEPIVEQLAALFSGSPRLGHFPARGTKGDKYLRAIAKLGSLPWVVELPDGDPKRVRDCLRNSQTNLIGLGDDAQGTAISGLSNVTYVALDRAPDAQLKSLPSKTIEQLRQALPEFLQTIIATTWNKTVDSWNTKLPAHAMYHGLAQLFETLWGSTQRAPVDMVVRAHYVPYTTTILPKFFEDLHQMFYVGTGKMFSKVFGPPGPEISAAAYVMQDLVLVDKSIVRTVNTKHKSEPLSISVITKELRDNGYLADVAPGRYGIDPERYWAISREIWEARVTQSAFYFADKPQLKVAAA